MQSSMFKYKLSCLYDLNECSDNRTYIIYLFRFTTPPNLFVIGMTTTSEYPSGTMPSWGLL